MARWRITAPNRHFSGVVAGVMFNSGVGETDNDSVLWYFVEAGYQVEPLDEPAPQEPQPEEKRRRK